MNIAATQVATPAVDTAYKFAVVQNNLGQTLYFTGEMSGYYLATSTNPAEGINVFVEDVEGGQRIYFLVGETKTYIDVVPRGEDQPGKVNVVLTAEPTCVFTWDAERKTYTTTVEENNWYLGCYSTYNTMSASNTSYIENVEVIGESQFPSGMYTVEGFMDLQPELGGSDEPSDEPANNDPAADSTLSVKDAIALGAAKEHNTYTEGKYYVTGVITEVYNDTYGNMYITDGNGNTLTIYGTYSADGADRYDALATKPVAGDTVTIYGIIGQYNGTPQIKNGWITAHTPGAGTGEPAEPSEPVETIDCHLVEGKGYKLTANNANGALWFCGGETSGRFNASASEADALLVYVEVVDGGFKMYTTDGTTKTYINMDDKAAGAAFTTDAAAATVYEWNGELGTLAVAEDSNNRALGTDPTKTYENFSSYDVSNGEKYDWVSFVE